MASSSSEPTTLSIVPHYFAAAVYTMQIHRDVLPSCCLLGSDDTELHDDLTRADEATQKKLLKSEHGGRGTLLLSSTFISEVAADIADVIGVATVSQCVAYLRAIQPIRTSLLASSSSSDATATASRSSVYGPLVGEHPLLFQIYHTSSLASKVEGGGTAVTPPSTATYETFTIVFSHSRYASAVSNAIAKHQLVVLQRCRLIEYEGGPAKKKKLSSSTSVPLSDREASKRRMNMDEDLWTTAVEWLAAHDLSSLSSSSSPSSLGSLAAFLNDERLQNQLLSLVQYVGAYDSSGDQASPFLASLVALFRFVPRLTLTELTMLSKHANRYWRAMALFYARFVLPVEELPPVFLAALQDDISIAVSSDGTEALSVKEIAMKLLQEEEVLDFWLPSVGGKQGQQTWVKWAIALMQEMQQREVQRNQTLLLGQNGPGKRPRDEQQPDAPSSSSSSSSSHATSKSAPQGNSSMCGFKSIRDLSRYVVLAERLSRADRVASLLGNGEEDDDEALWAKKHRTQQQQQGSDEGGADMGGGGLQSNAFSAQQTSAATSTGAASAVPQNQKNERRNDGVATVAEVRRWVVSKADKVLLGLVGRSKPFHADDHVYFEF